mmetsp:Transcript_3681/g.8302  ORF Transcript_3681/g.8302 Transcript_3681/m.8302 type:complete len:210 (+) Transcript_3681:9-638(+)
MVHGTGQTVDTRRRQTGTLRTSLELYTPRYAVALVRPMSAARQCEALYHICRLVCIGGGRHRDVDRLAANHRSHRLHRRPRSFRQALPQQQRSRRAAATQPPRSSSARRRAVALNDEEREQVENGHDQDGRGEGRLGHLLPRLRLVSGVDAHEERRHREEGETRGDEGYESRQAQALRVRSLLFQSFCYRRRFLRHKHLLHRFRRRCLR